MRFSLCLALVAVYLLTLAPTARADEARWIRYPAVSPDGSQVAFCARGDLWVVPIEGGEARPLTGHVAHERSPVWSPDGASLVFGIPQVGMQTADGRYLENLQLEPDVLVFNDPESVARGEDRQLEAAVRVLLEDLTR